MQKDLVLSLAPLTIYGHVTEFFYGKLMGFLHILKISPKNPVTGPYKGRGANVPGGGG